MRYAHIENGKVINVIIVKEEDLGLFPDWNLVLSETAGIDDDYINGKFIKPPQPEPVIPPRRISLDEIRNALTLAEKIKWDNNKTDEITTVKVEFAQPMLVSDAEPWLQLLVDSGSISQASIDTVL